MASRKTLPVSPDKYKWDTKKAGYYNFTPIDNLPYYNMPTAKLTKKGGKK